MIPGLNERDRQGVELRRRELLAEALRHSALARSGGTSPPVTARPHRVRALIHRFRATPGDDVLNSDRFDAFTRSLDDAPTRRRVLYGLIGAAFGLATPNLTGGASARNRRRNHNTKRKRKRRRQKKAKPCASGTKRCGKACIPATECCGGCDAGLQCCNGGCIPATVCCGGCDVALACCDGTCANLAIDEDNCGACGIRCALRDCVRGACICQDDAQCPDACPQCVPRGQGLESACTTGLTDQPCDVDEDCPLRSFCFLGGLCTVPCPV